MTKFVRLWLPLAVCIFGAAVMILKPDADGLEGGALIISAGLSIWLLNFLYRVGVSGDRTRDDEAAARSFFDEHGYWPDEAPPEPAGNGRPDDPGRHARPSGTPRQHPAGRSHRRPRNT
jgi:hypothetical protein